MSSKQLTEGKPAESNFFLDSNFELHTVQVNKVSIRIIFVSYFETYSKTNRMNIVFFNIKQLSKLIRVIEDCKSS